MSRRTVVILLVFLGLVCLLGGVALLALDLDRFRGSIAARIEEAVGRPVTLGSANLGWSGGPSLRFGNVAVGDFHATGLSLVADPWKLLRAEVVFREVVLEGPEFSWEPATGRPLPSSLSAVRGALRRVGTLKIRDGLLRLRFPAGDRPPLELRHIEGELSRAEEDTQVRGSARLVQEKSDAALELTASVPLDEPLPWSGVPLEVEVSLEGLNPSALLQAWGLDLSTRGRAAVRFRAEGTASSGISLHLDVRGSGLELLPPKAHPFPIGHLAASGVWLPADEPRVRDLRVAVDGASARGQVSFGVGKNSSGFRAEIDEAVLPLAGPGAPPFPWLQKHYVLRVDSGIVSGSLAEGVRLELKAALADEEDLPLKISGEVSPAGDPPSLDVTLEGDLPAERVSGIGPASFAATGSVAVTVRLHGPFSKPSAEIRADFSGVDLAWSDRFRKPVGTRGLLEGELSWSPGEATFRNARLNLGPLKLRGSGTLEPAGKFSADWELPTVDLAQAVSLLPPLVTRKPGGVLEAHGKISGAGSTVESFGGEARLRNGTLHLGDPFADLNAMEGTAELGLDQISLRGFHGRLGSSVVEGEGRFSWQPVTLDISARAEEVSPGDLFFSPEGPLLRNVSVDLRFRRDGVEIRNAQLSLPRGTNAAIHGEVRGYRHPPIELSVEAQTVRLDEVIALLRNPSRKDGEGGPVSVHFAAREGGWADFSFRDLSGSLRAQDRVLELEGLSLRPDGPFAKVSEASGRLAFEGPSLHISDVQGLLGSSRLRAEGTVENLSAPVLDVTVQSPELLASALFFDSDAKFRNLGGEFTADAEGLRIVHLGAVLGESPFTLQGKVSRSESLRAQLDVKSPSARLEDVLALFSQGPQRHTSSALGSARIALKVDEGNLGPLPFQDLEAVAVVESQVFRLDSVRFSAESGTCEGTVRVDRDSGTRRVAVTGTVSGADAELLQRAFQGSRGVVTGTLDADFQVSGKGTGGTFWSSSTGQGKLQVVDGVLRKFPILAKIFSLLNVSQIFRFQLPDMAREGMPFNRIEGSFDLSGGKLSTEDLRVESAAMDMSLVGRVDLVQGTLDANAAVRPLQTVDTIVSHIPLAGWVLGGKEGSLITAQFRITGPLSDPDIDAVPLSSLSDKVQGIFRRVLGLSGHAVEQFGGLLQGAGKP